MTNYGDRLNLKAFIEQKFRPNSKDYVAEMFRVNKALEDNYPSAKDQYNLLTILSYFRRVLYLDGKSRQIGQLYLPLAIAFVNRHRGKITTDDVYSWAMEAKNKYGFRNVSIEKIDDALHELNKREDLGWKDKIEVHIITRPQYESTKQKGAEFRTYKNNGQPSIMQAVAEALSTEEFKDWETKPVSTKKLVDKLKGMGKVTWLPKSISNAVSKLRLQRKSQIASEADMGLSEN